jgi:putative transposase
MVVPPRGRQPQKVWLTVFVDSYSRAVPGFAISLHPSQAEVLSAMMSGILVREDHGPFGGVPGIWRWDNGLDWLADSVSSAAIQLGSLPLGTAPYSPHQKGKVERFFRTLETECLATLPRYTNGPKGVNGKPYDPGVTPLSFDELVEAIETYIDHYNLERPHSALGGKTPLERWQEDATPIERRSREELRGLVLPVEERQVLKDGIHFRNLVFFAPELEGLRGEKVQIRFMPHDLREIEVLQDDQFVCMARPQGAVTEDEWKRFLATRSAEKKQATKRRKRAQRKARARLVATTESGTSPEEATPIDREKAREEGDLRADEGIREEASGDLLGLGQLNKPLEDDE